MERGWRRFYDVFNPKGLRLVVEVTVLTVTCCGRGAVDRVHGVRGICSVVATILMGSLAVFS